MAQNEKVSSRLIIKSGEEVLMSLGDTKSVKFVGGRIQQGESSLQAAIREAREEGGIDLIPNSLYQLPYQDNGDGRPSYWFGTNTPRYDIESLVTSDDVLELFWVTLGDVESQLTYDAWKEHWVKHLLPNLK